MSIGNEPAYPAKYTKHKTGEVGNQVPIMADGAGLTKRELFAAMAMQGILANRVYDPPRRMRLEGMSKDAVAAADALLGALSKEPGHE